MFGYKSNVKKGIEKIEEFIDGFNTNQTFDPISWKNQRVAFNAIVISTITGLDAEKEIKTKKFPSLPDMDEMGTILSLVKKFITKVEEKVTIVTDTNNEFDVVNPNNESDTTSIDNPTPEKLVNYINSMIGKYMTPQDFMELWFAARTLRKKNVKTYVKWTAATIIVTGVAVAGYMLYTKNDDIDKAIENDEDGDIDDTEDDDIVIVTEDDENVIVLGEDNAAVVIS